MDPRDRADALLARARARGRNIVTPDNMTSPMDASDTQQIPRTLVNSVDPRMDPDSTMILPAERIQHPQQQYHQPPPQPHHHQQPQPQMQQQGEVTQTVVAPGAVPTVQHHNVSRPSLSQRLNGGEN
ncbi:hypothetical protein FKR81_29150 [Lentzea tibetensis]|uniref:Uncharacterized protein n=1 Tax=Lentzea tibetensis TaxID=2591470 RepID=A0A563ENW5_9PSEU|nr:hypothetical protein [Lentzea tibetensis]TWP48355.1 hypothetical protein FKR81_29150 [Lentzea tibetensis]